MDKVTVKYEQFEPKKHSLRMKTEERMGGQYPLPDMYVPRSILQKLGLTEREQDLAEMEVFITYSLNPPEN